MRDRIRTPFFFIPWGERSTDPGEESPPRTVEGRRLVGQVVGGRFLLREKTGHSPDAVHYAAHDMMGGIDVTLEVYPDGTAAAGYRLGTPNAGGPEPSLPNLYNLEFTREQHCPAPAKPSIWVRLWRILIGRG